jgi:hypothetical protein
MDDEEILDLAQRAIDSVERIQCWTPEMLALKDALRARAMSKENRSMSNATCTCGTGRGCLLH